LKSLRTPDERFENLAGFPFSPQYLDVADPDGGVLRMHYVDEGPRDGRPVFLLHGEPTWSYLYRKMIPGLVAAGHRVIAPDQIGFGRSDKPTQKNDYTIERHVGWVRECIVRLDLQDAIFFGQDWGSLIGFTAALHEADRFTAIVAANAALPDPLHMDRMAEAQSQSPDAQAFTRWQEFAAAQDAMDVGAMLAGGIPGVATGGMIDLSPDEAAAYDAPFPDADYQAGVLIFPALAKATPEAVALFSAAWRVLEKWEKPFVTAYGKADPILGYFDTVFQNHVPGAKGMPHRQFSNGGHFIQEEEPEALVETILAAAAASPAV
jgi:haloalkane dehalogenase